MPKKNPKRRAVTVFFALLTLAWTALLFYFSGQTGLTSGALSGRITRALFGWMIDLGWVQYRPLHVFVRKAAHFALFAIEGGLIALTLGSALPKRVLIPMMAGVCALLAVGNELHEYFTAGRSCELRDMLIDFAGAMTGLALVLLIAWAARRAKRKNDI